MELAAWRDEIGLCLGRRPAAPAGMAAVTVHGADVAVDPADPAGPFQITVWDRDAARHVVGELVGETAAEAAWRLPPHGETPVEAERRPVTTAVAWLAVLGWLRGHTPDPLHDEVLAVEEAVAVLTVEDLAARELVAEAEERLHRSGAALARWAQRSRERVVSVGAEWEAFLAMAVPAALAVHDLRAPDGEPAEALRHESEVATYRGTAPGAVGGTWDLSRLAGRRVTVASHAGADPTQPASATGSVDWAQVPRGVLDGGEDTVSWRTAQDRLAVTAQAGPTARPTDRLGFRAYRAGVPWPVAWGPLTLAADGSVWTGSAGVDGSLRADDLEVDVFDLDDTRPPRLGAAARAARAERWAARGLTAIRLGATEPARGALEEATRTFRPTGTVGPALDARLRRGEARTAALVRAVLVDQGQDRIARSLERAWRDPLAPVEPQDVVVPRIDGPGWAPTAAEVLFRAGEQP